MKQAAALRRRLTLLAALCAGMAMSAAAPGPAQAWPELALHLAVRAPA